MQVDDDFFEFTAADMAAIEEGKKAKRQVLYHRNRVCNIYLC